MYINIHTHNSSESIHVKEIINMDASVFHVNDNANQLHSIGLHPWNIDSFKTERLKKIQNNPKLLAIGECGLDKHKGPNLSIQQKAFIAQIELSEKLQLPLIIHCVKAYSEIIKLHKDIQPRQAWIFHGFNATKETMEQAMNYNFYFSFGQSLFNPSSKASKVLPFIPNNRLFLETDNNPQLKIQSVYEKAAEIIKTDINDLMLIINRNFKRLFNVNTRSH